MTDVRTVPTVLAVSQISGSTPIFRKVIMDDRFVRLRGRDYATIIFSVLSNQLLGSYIAAKYPDTHFSFLYIDPGSGLLLWQLLVATAAGFVFNLRHRIARLFREHSERKQ